MRLPDYTDDQGGELAMWPRGCANSNRRRLVTLVTEPSKFLRGRRWRRQASSVTRGGEGRQRTSTDE